MGEFSSWNVFQARPRKPSGNLLEEVNLLARTCTHQAGGRTSPAKGEMSLEKISFPSCCRHGVWAHPSPERGGDSPPSPAAARGRERSLGRARAALEDKGTEGIALLPSVRPRGRTGATGVPARGCAVDAGSSGGAGWAHGCACWERGRIQPRLGQAGVFHPPERRCCPHRRLQTSAGNKGALRAARSSSWLLQSESLPPRAPHACPTDEGFAWREASAPRGGSGNSGT